MRLFKKGSLLKKRWPTDIAEKMPIFAFKNRLMQQIVINIEESRMAVFLQFLQTLNYVQVAQPPRHIADNAMPTPSEGSDKPHFLADLAGSLAGPDGDELAEILSREFQSIEGE